MTTPTYSWHLNGNPRSTFASGATLTPPLPSGTQPGDALILLCRGQFGANSVVWTVPAGWEPITGRLQTFRAGFASPWQQVQLWIKQAGASEAAPAVTASPGPVSGVAGWRAQVLSWRPDAPPSGVVLLGTPQHETGTAQVITPEPFSVGRAAVVICWALWNNVYGGGNLVDAEGFITRLYTGSTAPGGRVMEKVVAAAGTVEMPTIDGGFEAPFLAGSFAFAAEAPTRRGPHLGLRR